MKIFLKILAGIIVLFIAIAVGLNLYFTDERLKNTVMPYVNEAVGRPVQVESMSLTFFSTFPQPGLSISNLSIPNENESDTLMALNELVVGVKFFSLFSDEIGISEILLDGPHFIYTIREDSSSNIDFLLPEEAATDTSTKYAVHIPYFEISNGQFGYRNQISGTDVRLDDFDAHISLHYAEQIESTFDIQVGGLYVRIDGIQYADGLPLNLSEESTVDLENEIVNLRQGTFSIRGLALNLSGSINNWSSEPAVNLKFDSSSDNFGELLRLVPVEYKEYTQDLETRGSLTIEGSINGNISGGEIPAFNVSVDVTDGYVRNPDLPQPVEHIQFSAVASNELLTVNQLNAEAGSNNLTAAGELENPLEDDGQFALNLTGDMDLATVSSFYDLSWFDLERLGGKLDVQARAQGSRNNLKEASFNATLTLAQGALKYTGAPKSIENINIDADANQDVLIIRNMSFEAAENTFSMEGTVHQPLDSTNRTVILNSNLRFDLATVKDFYPISEDTLEMRGLLTAQVALNGKAGPIEQSVENGSINLSNGFIYYKKWEKPFRDITLESVLQGNRLTIVNAGFKTGENNLQASGLITNYLSDNRTINLQLKGHAELDEITHYYDLKPAIEHLSGNANLNLTAKGPVENPAEMTFNGNLSVSEVNMEGDSLVHPVHDLSGKLTLSPSSANLESLAFRIGSSDIELNGSLHNHMEYLKARPKRDATPHLTGSFHSKYLNLDELINWNDASPAPTPIHLPDLTSSVTISVERMDVTGVTMRNLEASAETTPQQIKLNQGSVELFEGRVSGSFVWDVPRPDHTTITFNGSLDGLRAESFFREYQVLGEKSDFHEYISGAFSAGVDHYSELDAYLNPVIETTRMDGNFGMTKARLKGHPLQEKLADLFSAKEFRNIVLDKWNSTFAVDNNILTFKNLRLTSGDIGVEMSGSQHLVKETIGYNMKLHLPGRYKSAIASVITKQAADALTSENGTFMIPLQITGTVSDPQLRPDQDVIKPIIQNYLIDKADDVLKSLFGRDN